MKEVVQGSTKLSLIRNSDIFYRTFTNNGSKFLNVDGSVTPIRFTLEGLVEDNFILNRIDYIISTDSAIDISSFGNVATLTNGVLFNIDGQQVFKTNGDMLMFGTDNSIHSAKVEGVTTSIINGSWDLSQAFQNGVICKKEDLYIEIRDDLSSLSLFEISASGIKLG